LIFGSGDNPFGRILILYVNAIAGYAEGVPAFDSVIENAFRRCCRDRFELTDRIVPTFPRFLRYVEG
jgi:hypothetical protein